MMLRSAAVSAGLALGLMSGTAKAELLSFDFASTSGDMKFALASTPTPSRSTDLLSSFDVTGSFNGVDASFVVSFYAYNTNLGHNGGIAVNFNNNEDVLSDGTQIFSGTTDSPTFSVGLYPEFDDSTAMPTPVSVTLSTVPLPASAPMFGAAIMALSAVGYGLKRKGKATA